VQILGERINNERLEFLGDSVLDTIVSEYLYTSFPESNEGFLTRMRANIVQRKTMNSLAKTMGLHNMILRDEKNCQKAESIYGNALEALIGAIYMDRGYRAAKYFVLNEYIGRMNFDSIEFLQYDHKSSLYHLIQEKKWKLDIQTVENIEESEHIPHFLAGIYIDEKFVAEGKGWSKKEAEQNAAKNTLEKLQS
jgi:ribonuclease-3